MKRLWIGVALLAAVLAISLATAFGVENLHAPGVEKLKQASDFALQEDWFQAKRLTEEADAVWRKWWKLTASVSNHEPMDTIDALFAELEVYGACRDSISFSGTCVHLAELLQALVEEHTLKWWNLL